MDNCLESGDKFSLRQKSSMEASVLIKSNSSFVACFERSNSSRLSAGRSTFKSENEISKFCSSWGSFVSRSLSISSVMFPSKYTSMLPKFISFENTSENIVGFSTTTSKLLINNACLEAILIPSSRDRFSDISSHLKSIGAS